VLGPVRDLQRAALVPIEPLAVDDAEAFAFEDVHRLLAMAMPAGVPANRDFRLEHIAAHGGEAEIVADHQLAPDVLGRAHPGNVLVMRHERRGPKLILRLAARIQPVIVERLHRLVPTSPPARSAGRRSRWTFDMPDRRGWFPPRAPPPPC